MPDSRLSYAVVGAGVMGKVHVESLAALDDDVEVVAVADDNLELAELCAFPVGARAFDDVGEMLQTVSPDLVIVATPHLSHASVAIACLDAGAHVIVEKPMAVDIAEADAMLHAARRVGKHLIVDLQYRFIPAVEAAKAFIDDGRLGRLLRATCVESTMRSAVYYTSAPWRGSWAGEGGGVLVNQAPHPLDLLCYLAGTPVRVVGWATTLTHAIECEDTVLAQIEFGDGGVAQVAFSTAEPTPLRIELIGERAKVELTAHSLAITTWHPDLATHIANDTTKYDPPRAVRVDVDLKPYGGDKAAHMDLHRDVVAALLRSREPRAGAATALAAVEVANAIVLSSERGGVAIDLPLDRDEYTALLSTKREARAVTQVGLDTVLGPAADAGVHARRIGVIMNGVTGRMGTNQHLIRSIMAIRAEGGLELPDGTRLVPEPLLLGRNRDRVSALAAECGVEHWSTDLDECLANERFSIYFDAQTTGARVAAVTSAIEAGKHVYCEKPLALSLDDALSLIHAARAAGVKTGIVQDKLFLPGFLKLKQLIDSGFFGRILSVRGEFGYWVFEGPEPAAQRPAWNYRAEDGGGIVVDMLCHWRYVLDNLFGRVRAVTAFAPTHIDERFDERGAPYRATADDAAYATLELEGGIVAQINSSWCVRVYRDDLLAFQVDGTDGSAVVGLREVVTQSRAHTPTAVWNPDVEGSIDYRSGWTRVDGSSVYENAFKAQWELFLRHIACDEPFRWDFVEGAKGIQLAEIALESFRSRRWLDVPELDL